MMHAHDITASAFSGGSRWLAVAAGVLFATGSASAQTTVAMAGAPATPAEAQAAPDTKPVGFTIGGFTFKVGGRIKLDIIRDFDPIGSEDSFDPRTIPVDGGEGGNSTLHARETRLSLDMRGPVEGKELRMYVETDFYGSGNALRLRQAYGTYGGLLAGQAYSTFVDESNFPNTLDFESPMAFPSIRQAQLRYTGKLSQSFSWSAAVEDNKSTIVPPDEPGNAEYSMPDLVARLRYERPRGHAFTSFFLGRARFRPIDAEPDDVTLWGALFSGRIKTFGRDYAYGQVTIGDGVGRYRGAATAVPDLNGRLQPVALVGVMGGYEHFWSDRLSTHFVISEASQDEEEYFAAETSTQLDYAAINLIYWFLKDRAWVGVEYLHGGREVFSGASGEANRLQFSVRFNLPS
jgi:hypothetical protein